MVRIERERALRAPFDAQGPAGRRLSRLRRLSKVAVAHHLRIQAAVAGVVDLLEEDAVQLRADCDAGPVHMDGQSRRWSGGRRYRRDSLAEQNAERGEKHLLFLLVGMRAGR